MYKKILSGILVVLLIAIIGALGYLGYGYFSKYNTEKEAERYLEEEFESIIVPINQENQEQQATNPENPDNTNNGNNNNTYNNGGNTSNSGYYKGFKVAGKLEMPSIKKQFPILDESVNAKAIEVSVVKVYGPELNNPGNAVIGGHNNNNGTFFSRNKNLKIGDKIYITDLTGNRVQYTITDKYYTPETDNSYFNRQTDGRVEVTLYTCDATGKNRLIICARAD